MLEPKYGSPGSIPKTCPNCSLDIVTEEMACPQCRHALQKVSTLRVLGVVQVILGIFLMSVMAVLSFLVFNIVRNADDPSATTRFTGSDKDLLFIIGIFGIVFLVGVTSFAGGAWQIVFGKRNKYITRAILVFGALFMLIGLAVSF